MAYLRGWALQIYSLTGREGGSMRTQLDGGAGAALALHDGGGCRPEPSRRCGRLPDPPAAALSSAKAGVRGS